MPAEKSHRFKGRHDAKKEQYGQICAEKFTYVSLISIVKTKVISARVAEAVHELLHQQAEDAGMTLSEFAAQMLMKGRVNSSYVFYGVQFVQALLEANGLVAGKDYAE